MIAIYSKLGQSLTGPANKIANDMQRIATTQAKIGKASQTTAKTWTVSWETMARVVATQTIVRALNIIRQSLKAAIGDAVKFQKAVAEIGTISPAAVGDLNNIADVVKRISDEFNVDIGSTAEAAYQTISNQVAKTDADLQSFLGSAAKFAKITKTDVATSVNLLSGVLNAFGKDVSETEEVAAKFFKTIELGRTRAEELALGYGTVAPIADKLNISMEELNASIATLTINGIKTDKAFTQIRGTMQAFLKPTGEMKDALKELGFESGEQLLQANNLQEALRLVAGVTDGTAAAIAKLFPRIRGLTGVLTALDDQAGHFNKTMEEQKTALTGAYDRAYKLVIDTPAEKITKELNQLKNFFTVEFGQSVLEASIKLSKAVGGAGSLIDIFKVMGPLLPPLAAGLGIVAVSLALVATRAALAKSSLSGLNKAVLAYTAAIAAVGAGKFIAARISDTWDAEFRAASETLGRELEARKLKIAAEISAEKDKVRILTKLLGKALAESRKEFFKVADASKESNKEIISDVERSTNRIIAQRQKMVTALQSQVNKAGDNIVSSEKRAANLRDDLDDQLFKRKIARDSDRVRFNKLTQKSNELAANANAKLARSFKEEDRAKASEEFQRAKAFADQALAIADATGNRNLEKKALSTLKNQTEDLIIAEKSYRNNVAKTAKLLQARSQKEQKNVDKLKKKQKELLDAFSIVDKETGKLLSPQERAQQFVKAGKLLREFVDLSGDPLDVSTMLNFTGIAAQLQQSFHQFEIKNLVISKEALGKINSDINAAINQRKKDPAFGLAEGILGRDIQPGADEAVALDELGVKYDKLFATRQKYLEQGTELHQAQRSLANSLKEASEGTEGMAAKLSLLSNAVREGLTFGFSDSEIPAFLGQMEKALALAKKAQATGGAGIHPDEITRMLAASQAAVETLPGDQLRIWGNYITDVSNALAKTNEVVKARLELKKILPDAGTSTSAITEEISKLNEAIQLLEAPKATATVLATSLVTASTAQANMVAPSQAAATAHQSSAASLSQMAADSVTIAGNLSNSRGFSGGVHSQGGQVGYFAHGGQGTDTIPAMLSAGEHITNARSSRRFFSQLQAMNAGQTPVFKSEGGDTYNTNVGDINVSGTGSPQVVARDVMRAIRREERRGSGR